MCFGANCQLALPGLTWDETCNQLLGNFTATELDWLTALWIDVFIKCGSKMPTIVCRDCGNPKPDPKKKQKPPKTGGTKSKTPCGPSTITLCTDYPYPIPTPAEILAHELIHAKQHCMCNTSDDCRAVLCREIEAYCIRPPWVRVPCNKDQTCHEACGSVCSENRTCFVSGSLTCTEDCRALCEHSFFDNKLCRNGVWDPIGSPSE